MVLVAGLAPWTLTDTNRYSAQEVACDLAQVFADMAALVHQVQAPCAVAVGMADDLSTVHDLAEDVAVAGEVEACHSWCLRPYRPCHSTYTDLVQNR